MEYFLSLSRALITYLNKRMIHLAAYASMLSTAMLCTILALIWANGMATATSSTTEETRLPYSERVVANTLEVSSKKTAESFDGKGFTPEGPAGTEFNIPPGYKDRDYQKASYSRFGYSGMQGIPVNSGSSESVQRFVQNAAIDLESNDVKGANQKINDKVKIYGGFVEKESVRQDSRDRYIAELVIRIKAENVSKFLTEMGTIGNIRSSQNTLADITAEYRDTKIRLENKMKVRASILRILERQTGDIKDIIEGTKELSEITESIETLQASLKSYDDKVLFATVTARIFEPSAILPERSESIWKKILASFGNAGYLFIDLLSFLIKSLGIILPLGLIAFWLFRKKLFKSKSEKKLEKSIKKKET